MGSGFTGVGNYGPQGGNVGINYAQGGLSANVSAPVSERTDSVKLAQQYYSRFPVHKELLIWWVC